MEIHYRKLTISNAFQLFLKKITDFIKKAELHHTILVSFPTIKSDFPSQLEGVVLIDPTEDSDLPPPKVCQYLDNPTSSPVFRYQQSFSTLIIIRLIRVKEKNGIIPELKASATVLIPYQTRSRPVRNSVKS